MTDPQPTEPSEKAIEQAARLMLEADARIARERQMSTRTTNSPEGTNQ